MNTDKLDKAIRTLMAKYQETLTSSDTAEAVAKRWTKEVQSWKISRSIKSEEGTDHRDLMVYFLDPSNFIRDAFPAWAQRHDNGPLNFPIGNRLVYWDGRRLYSRFATLGVSTEELEGQIRGLMQSIDEAVEGFNKEIERRSDRLSQFEAELESKRAGTR